MACACSPDADRGLTASSIGNEKAPNSLILGLEEEGYRTRIATDGAQALKILEAHPEDTALVITDIEMPHLDGLGLTAQIRADTRFAGLPVIAVTSLAGEEDQQRGLEAGVDEYLTKLNREKILSAVHHHLERCNP